MIGPVPAIGVLPDKLNGNGAFHIVGHVEQLATDNADIVPLVTGLGLGRCPLDGDGLLLLGWRGRCFSITLWRALLWWGQLLVLWLLLVLDRRLRGVPHSAKVVHDTSLLLIASGD